jgi:hypothetical protein
LREPTRATSTSTKTTAPISGGPFLGPGTYWISVQSSGPYGWHWATTPAQPQIGAEAVWQNPGKAVSDACPTWHTLTECNMTEPAVGDDLSYTLFGTIADSRFSLGEFTTKGRKLFVNGSFLGAGTLDIRGDSLKHTSSDVASGQRTVRLKLNGKGRRTLGAGDKLRVAVTASLTAPGGVPYQQHAGTTVELKRGTLAVVR